MDTSPHAPPPEGYLDHLAWLDDLEHQHSIEILT